MPFPYVKERENRTLLFYYEKSKQQKAKICSFCAFFFKQKGISSACNNYYCQVTRPLSKINDPFENGKVR